MSRLASTGLVLGAVLGTGVLLSACSAADGKTKTSEAPAASAPAPISVEPFTVTPQPISRFVRVTGSLVAEEQAEVAAETAGRVVATPIERGTRIALGTELVELSPTETDAQVREAEANAAQIEARLGIGSSAAFDVNAVPEVQNAKASYDLAQSEFARISSLLDQKVVSQSEFDQRRTQLEAMRQQYEAAKNAAAQQFQSLQAARARVGLAKKALADTVVRAPFAGLVAERLVSVGDYVTRGTKVAVVVRVNPLRAQLTVPEQSISAVSVGQPVNFEVDAYPGRQFTGTIRFVSPSLKTDQRALTVEATVPNPTGELKPGLFATAQIQQPNPTPGLLVPSSAIVTAAGTSRVFLVNGDHVENRVVSLGQTVGDQVEVTNGLKSGDRIATTNLNRLADGRAVSN
jgi:RND family efflux transporter MFP subunit